LTKKLRVLFHNKKYAEANTSRQTEKLETDNAKADLVQPILMQKKITKQKYLIGQGFTQRKPGSSKQLLPLC